MFRKKHTTRLDALRKLEQEQTNQKRKLITRARLEGLASSGINAVLFAVVSVVYLIIHYTSDLPDFEQLQRYEPKMVTRLYAGDGRLLEEYAKEKRIFVPIDVIPEQLQNAFISAEDKNFYDHEGIDVQGILRAAVTNFKNLGNEKGLVGGSTITQQVVKNFLLSSEKKYERKIKEAILALRISQVFSKKKVMELYLNEIYLGAGSYGVAAASIRYFDKSIYDLSLEEMAMLASLPKAPNTYNPKRNPEAAKERRNWVIDRMLEQEYINAQEAEEAKAKPITIIEKDQSRMVFAPVFAEEVRRKLVNIYGEDTVYKGGLTVHTTINAKLQQFAEDALLKGIATYDKRHGYKGAIQTIGLDNWKQQLEEISIQGLPEYWKKAVVLSLSGNKTTIALEDGSKGQITFKSMEWAQPRELLNEWERVQKQHRSRVPLELAKEWQRKLEIKEPSDVFAVGDVILVSKAEGKEYTESDYLLEQIPDANGALVAMDPHTGRVLAMAGGLPFKNTAFNRATQAQRQPGSAFKPFVYLTALELGIPPNTIIMDEPIELKRSDNGMPWRPQNYSGEFYGPTPMRIGLEKSRNVMTIQLAKTIGLRAIEKMAVKFGLYYNLPKNDFSAILGSAETNLMLLTNAYAMIVNGGKRTLPEIIETVQDKNGRTIYRRDRRRCVGCTFPSPEAVKANALPPIIPDNRERLISPESAYQITSLLRGVVLRGTGVRAARALPDYAIAGKTGTTNSSIDTWFIGFTPDLVCGVFVGNDSPTTLGNKETGSNVALPVFINFMTQALDGKPSIPFRIPKGISLVNIDAETGLLPSADTKKIIEEAFKVGNEPTEESDYSDWRTRYGGQSDVRNKIEKMRRDDQSPVGTGGFY